MPQYDPDIHDHLKDDTKDRLVSIITAFENVARRYVKPNRHYTYDEIASIFFEHTIYHITNGGVRRTSVRELAGLGFDENNPVMTAHVVQSAADTALTPDDISKDIMEQIGKSIASNRPSFLQFAGRVDGKAIKSRRIKSVKEVFWCFDFENKQVVEQGAEQAAEQEAEQAAGQEAVQTAREQPQEDTDLPISPDMQPQPAHEEAEEQQQEMPASRDPSPDLAFEFPSTPESHTEPAEAAQHREQNAPSASPPPPPLPASPPSLPMPFSAIPDFVVPNYFQTQPDFAKPQRRRESFVDETLFASRDAGYWSGSDQLEDTTHAARHRSRTMSPFETPDQWAGLQDCYPRIGSPIAEENGTQMVDDVNALRKQFLASEEPPSAPSSLADTPMVEEEEMPLEMDVMSLLEKDAVQLKIGPVSPYHQGVLCDFFVFAQTAAGLRGQAFDRVRLQEQLADARTRFPVASLQVLAWYAQNDETLHDYIGMCDYLQEHQESLLAQNETSRLHDLLYHGISIDVRIFLTD